MYVLFTNLTWRKKNANSFQFLELIASSIDLAQQWMATKYNLVASPSGYVIGRPDASQGAAENKTLHLK